MATKIWAPPMQHEHDLPDAIFHAGEIWRCDTCKNMYKAVVDTADRTLNGWRWKRVSRVELHRLKAKR